MHDTDFALALIQKLSFDNCDIFTADFQSRLQQIKKYENVNVSDANMSLPDVAQVLFPKGLFLVPSSPNELQKYSYFSYFYADLKADFNLRFHIDSDYLRSCGNLLQEWEADIVEESSHACLSAQSLLTLSDLERIRSEDNIIIKSHESAVRAVLVVHENSLSLKFKTVDQSVNFDLHELEHVFLSGLVQAQNTLFLLDDIKILPLVLDLFLYGPILVPHEHRADILLCLTKKLCTAHWIFNYEACTITPQKPQAVVYFRANSINSIEKAKIYLAFRYENEELMSVLHEDFLYQRQPLAFNFTEDNLEIKISDKLFEKKCEKSISEIFTFNQRKKYWEIINLENLSKKIWAFIAEGYEVWVEKIKVELLENINIETVSTINWFDAQIKNALTGEVFTIVELLKYLKRKKIFLQAGSGSLYVLPEKWVEMLQAVLLKGINLDDTTMRFSNLWAEDVAAQKAKLADSSPDPQLAKNASLLKAARAPQAIEQIPGLRCVLRNYQLEGVGWLEFLHSCNCGGILADDMGLGKTLQIIAFLYKKMVAEAPQKNLVALIICPKSVAHHWAQEIQTFAPGLVARDLKSVLKNIKKGKKIARVPTIVLSTYGMILHHEKLLENICFDFIILDEAQYIKNSFSRISQATKNLKSHSRFALTGTPIENRLSELINIIEFLNPLVRIPYVPKAHEEKASEYLFQTIALIKPLILRRLKKDLLTELPEKIETTLYVPMNIQQKQMHAHWFDQAELEYKKFQSDSGTMQVFLEALLRLRQAALLPSLWVGSQSSEKISSGKLDFLEEKIPELIQDNHKIVIFSQFIGFLKALIGLLERKKISHAYFDGSTPNREAAIDFFQNNENCQVLLASLKAGGIGIDLTSADVCIISDPWWNPAVEEQAMDRLYRMGQKNTVQIFRLVSKDSIEEKMLLLKDIKSALMKEIPVAESGFLEALKSDDFKQLFTYVF